MMKLALFIFILFLLGTVTASESRRARIIDIGKSRMKVKWTDQYKNEKHNKLALLSLLEQSTQGKEILRQAHYRAKKLGKELIDVIFSGRGSLTDTTLVRRFSPRTPEKVKYRVKSVVYINRDLSVKDAVLDLAHELTHFIHRGPFNPYDFAFSLPEFIDLTIAGKGGEVEAYLMECRVMKELFGLEGTYGEKCRKVSTKNGDFSKEKGVKLFFQVGESFKDLKELISVYNDKHNVLNKVSDDFPMFISSAYSEPYPLAAVKEYYSVKQKACQNEGKRISYMQDTLGRGPASRNSEKDFLEFMKEYRAVRTTYQTQCESLPKNISKLI